MKKWPRVVRIVGAAVTVALMHACGGGSATGSGVTNVPAEPASVEIRGTLAVPSPGGAIEPAPAGIAVTFAELASSGAVLRTLGTSSTDSAGTFKFTLPAGTAPGPLLLAQSTVAGQGYRAVVIDTAIDLNPRSEAITQEWLDALQAAPGLSESVTRMQRFLRAATQFIGLMPVRYVTATAQIAAYRSWLHDDPATRNAFQDIRSRGRLPDTLGDIGGLFGIGQSAWVQVGPGGGRRLALYPLNDQPGHYGLYDMTGKTALEAFQTPKQRLLLANDGFSIEWFDFGNNVPWMQRVFAQWLGAVPQLKFGARIGDVVRATDISLPTTGYTFDADNLEDQLRIVSDVTFVGPESVAIMGEVVPGMRVDVVTTVTIALSAGGNLTSVERRTDWCVPFAGVVRSVGRIEAIDAAGQRTTDSYSIEIERAAVNGMSWPGRVHVAWNELALPGASTDYEIHGTASANEFLVATKNRDRLYKVDLHSGQPVASLAIPFVDGIAPSVLRSSPDGRKFYAGYISSAYVPGTPAGEYRLLADATAIGAPLVRIDTTTMTEDFRIRLPGIPSTQLAGMGFARPWIADLRISPADPTLAVVQSTDVFQLRDRAVSAQSIKDPEAAVIGQSVISATLGPWDGDRNRIYLKWTPVFGNDLTWFLPIDAEGLVASHASGAFALAVSGTFVGPRPYDEVVGNHLYARNASFAFDLTTGALSGQSSVPASSGPYPSYSPCKVRSEDVLCISESSFGDRVRILNPVDLSLNRELDLQSDLRALAGTTIGVAGTQPFHVDHSEILGIRLVPVGTNRVGAVVRINY